MPQVIEQSLFLFQGGKERHSAHYRTPPHFLLFSPPCHCLPFEERRGLFISRIWRKINLPFLLLANYGAFPSRRRNFSSSFPRSSSHISPWDTLAPRAAQFFFSRQFCGRSEHLLFPQPSRNFSLERERKKEEEEKHFFFVAAALFSRCASNYAAAYCTLALQFFSRKGRSLEKKRDIFCSYNHIAVNFSCTHESKLVYNWRMARSG